MVAEALGKLQKGNDVFIYPQPMTAFFVASPSSFVCVSPRGSWGVPDDAVKRLLHVGM